MSDKVMTVSQANPFEEWVDGGKLSSMLYKLTMGAILTIIIMRTNELMKTGFGQITDRIPFVQDHKLAAEAVDFATTLVLSLVIGFAFRSIR